METEKQFSSNSQKSKLFKNVIIILIGIIILTGIIGIFYWQKKETKPSPQLTPVTPTSSPPTEIPSEPSILNPGDEFYYKVSIIKEGFDPTKGFFYGDTTINGTKLTHIKFIIDDGTKFYTVYPSAVKGKTDLEPKLEYVEKVDVLFFKKYVNFPYGPKGIKIKGIVLAPTSSEIIIDVDEVLMFVQ